MPAHAIDVGNELDTASAPPRLGELLVRLGAVTAERLEMALAEQARRPGARLGTLLDVGDEALSRALAAQFGLPWGEKLQAPDHEWLELLPQDVLTSGAALPIGRDGAVLTVAIADPSDPDLLERISIRSGLEVRAIVVPATALQAAARSGPPGHGSLSNAAWARLTDESGTVERLEAGASLEAITEEALADGRFPVARFVNGLLLAAVREDASDVHVEPRADGVSIKFRLDGVLVPRVGGLRMGLLAPIVSRIKVLARLDVAESRVPQDGRFRVWVAGREVDFRVAVLPTVLGESAVLRVLDRKSTLLCLDTLGFEAEELRVYRRQVQAPYGMVLVSGPTGSGKTTTLYAAIRDVYREGDKWITIEEPVEYQLDGVMQIPVNPRRGVTFAQGLRAIVRQDPDRLMVGEIRDRETAEIAVNAALTGHLVLSTIHANNVLDTLGRLRHLGLEPYQLASSLNLIMAQRLVRRLCPACKRPRALDGRDRDALGESPGELDFDAHFVPGGCERCNGTGYKGRRPIFEMLNMTGELREAILGGASSIRLRTCAISSGMCELRRRAMALVRSGETSLEEMARVTRHEQ